MTNKLDIDTLREEIERFQEGYSIMFPEIEYAIQLLADIYPDLEAMQWQSIDTAPSYAFSDDNFVHYLIRAVGDQSGRIIHTVGHFKEDGFYLEEGGELSYAFSPTHWMPLPKPPQTQFHG